MVGSRVGSRVGTGTRAVAVSLVAVAALAALAACAAEESPPVAAPGQSTSPTAGSSAASPESPTASSPSGAPASFLPESMVEPPSGVVVARRLKVTARVEKRDLPTGLTSSRIRGMRYAWNERGEQLAEMRAGKDDKVCVARPGKTWLGVFRTDMGRLLVGMGPLDPDGKPRCTVDGASLLVDSSTREVLGRGRVALLL